MRALLALFTVVAAVGLIVVAEAQAAPRVYHVAQLHPQARDENPGTGQEPLKAISAALKLAQPGDTVLVETGVYRETVTVPQGGERDQPVRLQAAPLAQVVVTGADLVTAWTRESGDSPVFSTEWSHVFVGWSPTRTHPADAAHQEIGRCEQVLVMGYLLKQVLRRELLSPGTFYVDEPGKRLYAWDRAGRDLSTGRFDVEASVRQVLLDCRVPYVQVRGITFRYAANQAQSGAVQMLGDYGLLEDCVIEKTNSSGASFGGKGLVVRRCVFRDNGQLGFSAHTDGMLFTGCVCERNNTKDFSRGWEAGGNKLVLCKDTVLEQSIFRGNYGNGIWFDIGNENCTVRNCLISDNQDAGIFYEISYGLHAHDNVIIGNGFCRNLDAWGANGGITLSSSPGCVIERNLLVANKEGFQYREQRRQTPRVGEAGGKEYPVWNHDNILRRNCLAYNRDFQVGGWFDMPNAQHWPRARQAAVLGKEPPAQPVWPAGTDMTRLDKYPEGLGLEDLRLQHSDNVFAARPGQRLLVWGPYWQFNQVFDDLAAVGQALGLEQRSAVAEVAFADWATGDLRVRADSPLLRLECYPRGEVPGVKLGRY